MYNQVVVNLNNLKAIDFYNRVVGNLDYHMAGNMMVDNPVT